MSLFLSQSNMNIANPIRQLTFQCSTLKKSVLTCIILLFLTPLIPAQSSAAGLSISLSRNALSFSDTATLATGCFWCTEAKFKELKGVLNVTAGFTGGKTVNPTYEEVCTGNTGHAEACNIVFDPKQISFDDLLQVFFTDHDPTQLNRQGNDVGTQYRSAIFYHNNTQKQKAEYYIKRINDEKAYKKPVVTQVVPFKVFYKAEDYHQNYFSKNGNEPYCRYVIQPELDRFRKAFSSKLKVKK